MKLRLIYFLMLLTSAAIIFQSSSSGAAANFPGDRTGSPLSNNGGGNGQCSNCHSGALNNTALVVTVKDGSGTAVTEYVPGGSYTMEFAVTSTSSFQYGFQGVALTGANAQAGTFGTPTSNFTKVTNLNGRQYVEHSQRATSTTLPPSAGFTFIIPWTAPAQGTGTVTVYSDAVTVNGNGSVAGDDPAGPLTVVLTESVSATIAYANASYCQGDPDPTPTITGATGGTFSSTAGLSINSSTGQIDVSASTPGGYTVTYTYGGGATTTASVTVLAAGNSSFNYSAPSYCVNSVDPTPTVTGTTGGSFSSTAGLSINSSTGQIDVSASTPGNYQVTYTTPAPCAASSIVSVTINALDDASFGFSAASFCANAADPTPTITGTVGGTFSSTAGLSLNSSTGQIDVSASTPGNYTVTYTTSGACPNSSTASVTISALDNASFNYGNNTYCVNAADPTPTITGATGGTFSSTTGLSLNSSTGQIDLSASTPGNYTVTYTTSGACPNSSTASVTINALDDASFNYGNNTYCVNAADPTPTITGTTGGTFSSTTGLSLNSSTGQIDLSASTPGNYTVTYTTSGACPNSSTASVTINTLDDASFNYGNNTYCVNAADPTPTITGATGGTFSSTTGLSLNSSTGQIDLSASTPGNYTVTYTTSGACPNSNTASVTINTLDDASFNYGNNTYCVNAADPTPTITGTTGGTFSSTTGLSLNSSTGQIDVSTSTPGNYTVTYTTSGACPNSSTASVTINTLDDASFNYGNNTYCINAADPTPTITGTTGGTFSSTTGLSLNSSTGQIDVSTSTPGNYTVTYTTSGACTNSGTTSVTINALDDASFSYMNSTYCQNDTDPMPTVTGLAGGVFSSTAGLSISSNGLIDVSASTPGNYTVTYTTSGTCPNSSTASVTINATPSSAFTYASAAYCQDATDPTPTITGATGGTFSSTTGLVINATTGEVDLGASTVGMYTVTYTVTGTCSSSSTTMVEIIAVDVAAFDYTDTTICINVGVNPVIAVTGTTTGTYSSNAAGLVFADAATGEIDLSASTIGNYVVTYTSNSTCPTTATVNVDLSTCGGLAIANPITSYAIFPNPNNGSFVLDYEGTAGEATILVQDVFGKVVEQQAIELDAQTRYNMNLNNISSGVYMITIIKEGTRKTIKMIIRE